MDIRHLDELDPSDREALVRRDTTPRDLRDSVEDIIMRVRTHGDDALKELTETHDEVTINRFDVTSRLEAAVDAIPDDIRRAIEHAAENIRLFHERQLPTDWRVSADGRELGRQFRPIEHVGVYVPGGTAAYPSSALMGVIPAVVAGVDQITVTTPPAEKLNPVTLAALEIAGATTVFSVGGAQAIAALAYGTESIPAVQKIVGPGNRWVTTAKRLVQGDVAIDFPAGPSELLVLADETATPAYIAADMIAQAEHDPNAAVVAITTSDPIATEIIAELHQQINDVGRQSVIKSALNQAASGVFLAASESAMASFAEAYAPEHLSIQTANPESMLDQIASAGSVFLGPFTPVAAGDYASGTNHILPTGGQAKVTGGVSVDTFLRATTIQSLDRGALDELRDTITTLADAEGLGAHAHSIDVRFTDDT